MNDLQFDTGPINPYARTFFWLWGAALLALAGFRAVNSTETRSTSAVNAINQSVWQPGAGTFRTGFYPANQVNTHDALFQNSLN